MYGKGHICHEIFLFNASIMFHFKNKRIVILSPDAWGVMKLSKHHYAATLASLGNEVFFIEPPDLKQTIRGSIEKTPEGVHVVRYKPFARGKKYIGNFLYSLIQAFHIRKFILKITGRPDVVWCFDLGTFDSLKSFSAPVCIFHPVDHTIERKAPRVASNADYIFSTSHKILEYMISGKKGMVVKHGLNIEFERFANQALSKLSDSEEQLPFRGNIGFWGSLFKESLDIKKVLTLIDHYPSYSFFFWGAFKPSDSNLSVKADLERLNFIDELISRKNVVLKGAKKAEYFLQEIENIDFFINIEFAYSLRWDNGNPHKIMEYLATGKPIFSTAVIMYSNTDLLFESTSSIASDFNEFIQQWQHWSSIKEREKRLLFALDNTYKKQIERVEDFISSTM